VSLLYKCLPYQSFVIPNTVCSSLYIIMIIKQQFYENAFELIYILHLYSSSVILVVFVLSDVLTH
jgi:hypothetical protein